MDANYTVGGSSWTLGYLLTTRLERQEGVRFAGCNVDDGGLRLTVNADDADACLRRAAEAARADVEALLEGLPE